MGMPVVVSGLQRIPGGKAILAFNHSSYVDVLALAAVLPGEPAFVAKKELAAQIFAGPPLRRLGALFVERYDLAGSIADAEAIAAAARLGRMIVFFPEGTFTRRPGLSGFYLGAFKVAAGPTFQSSRASCEERDPSCAAINGFPEGLRSASISRKRSGRRAPILPPSYGFATRCAKRSWKAAASRISASW
jgi:1-acyl-sn-glycerol-3-phosphate acyltransferase